MSEGAPLAADGAGTVTAATLAQHDESFGRYLVDRLPNCSSLLSTMRFSGDAEGCDGLVPVRFHRWHDVQFVFSHAAMGPALRAVRRNVVLA